MTVTFAIMLLTLFLSLFHFSYGYKEAIRISNEEGPVDGFPIILSLPLGFTFAYLSSIFYQLI
ncbi:hypothetical protein [Metabacillus sediminilitoris]|jgi:hypothetical protein|uniref:Uncharacterized protein n=1 Tax=Metabacillus sediminilitoris TaxID=2567941 RepID=A0A4S4BRH1_9BACI|nr:hypothetical protein [Metabacillus sediminilitoris]QGQ47650.1 hypothetical protein GMB29_21780 [Metabacillus sediminilitoris]THF76759.1 hypothetical protein E6W99_20400 [Metabacillus sediminilitoris]